VFSAPGASVVGAGRPAFAASGNRPRPLTAA